MGSKRRSTSLLPMKLFQMKKIKNIICTKKTKTKKSIQTYNYSSLTIIQTKNKFFIWLKSLSSNHNNVFHFAHSYNLKILANKQN